MQSHDPGNQMEKEKHLRIFVNRLPFEESQGVKSEMTVDEIARLVDLTAENAVVRRSHGDSGNVGDPLIGTVEVKNGDQFVVLRRIVEGGYADRIQMELSKLRESGQEVDFIPGPPGYVLYLGVYSPLHPDLKSDVAVPIPNGFPAAMIDRAALPVGSPLFALVKGAPQEIISIAGRAFQIVSYHPHAGGGGQPWDPNRHGFHTYYSEILAWLGVRK